MVGRPADGRAFSTLLGRLTGAVASRLGFAQHGPFRLKESAMRLIDFWTRAAMLVAASLCAVPSHAAEDQAPWFHPKAQRLDVSETGPFAQLKDGTLVTIRGGDALLSRDEGKTWQRRPISTSHNLKASPEIVVFATREGTLVMAMLNLSQEKWGWDEKENR